jgi:hypothetical protein
MLAQHVVVCTDKVSAANRHELGGCESLLQLCTSMIPCSSEHCAYSSTHNH